MVNGKKPCDCNKSSIDGGIERNGATSEIKLLPVSSSLLVVVVRVREEGSVNICNKKLSELVGNFSDTTLNGIRTVTFTLPIGAELDASTFLSCSDDDKKGVERMARGEGGVWSTSDLGCRSKTCRTPWRSASCDTVMNECWAKLDTICGGMVGCYVRQVRGDDNS
jgi:hypothetical protein